MMIRDAAAFAVLAYISMEHMDRVQAKKMSATRGYRPRFPPPKSDGRARGSARRDQKKRF